MNKLNKIITLEFLEEHNACHEGIEYFEEKIKEPITVKSLINKLLSPDERGKTRWISWLLICLFDRKQIINYAIFAAEQVLPIFELKYPDDSRPREAIEAAKQVAINDKHENEIIAYEAAYAASEAANMANAAAYTFYAASATSYAAWTAYGAKERAYAATNAVAYTLYAADATVGKGKEMLLKIINYGIKLLEDEN